MEKTLTSGGGYFDLIPVDLIIKILSKLSWKSLGKCRCVSKIWSSIICRPNYNQLFPIKSPDPPRLLFAVEVGEKLYFYSIPQPEKQYNNSSVTATFHHADSGSTGTYKVCPSVHGLVCYERMEDENHIVAVISNPITGEYVTSPKLLTYRNMAKTYFGYDPINKKFKVLCLTRSHRGNLQHQVLTLETNGKRLLWRKIPCCISYSPQDDGICINGILYYYTYKNAESVHKPMIIGFNVRSEKFQVVTGQGTDQFEFNIIPTLINYKGKLGACAFNEYDFGFVLWVLEEHKWSKHIEGLISSSSHAIGGVTSSGEVVFCPKYATRVPFYIFYYNLESKIAVKVRVEIPEFDGHSSIKAFSHYVVLKKTVEHLVMWRSE